MNRLVLIGCVKGKLEHPAPAADLYVSHLFQLRRAHAEASGHPWAILSAFHGIVEPGRVLAPYDYSMQDVRRNYDLRLWGIDVVRDAFQLFGWDVRSDEVTLEVHAGQLYVEPLQLAAEAFRGRVTVEAPTRQWGGIGSQKQRYAQLALEGVGS